jgi:S1-C subfamily serine protease
MRILKAILRVGFLITVTLGAPHLHDKFMYEYKGSSVSLLYVSMDKTGGGTGFQVKAPSGKQVTLTNKHVCSGSKDGYLYAEIAKKETVKLKIRDISKSYDLCVLDPIPTKMPLSLASSSSLRENAYLIGHPALRPLTYKYGYLIGYKDIYVAAPCPVFRFCINSYKSVIFDISSYPGNSGSPILDKWGNVISVLFAGNPNQDEVSYGVPLSYIKDYLSAW